MLDKPLTLEELRAAAASLPNNKAQALMGFQIPNRSTVINITHLFLNLQVLSDNLGNRSILSLHAPKAFDSIE